MTTSLIPGTVARLLAERQARAIARTDFNPPVTVRYTCGQSGLEFRTEVRNVASVTYEPYPPGGVLRVMRDARGKLLDGPLDGEITSWSVA